MPSSKYFGQITIPVSYQEHRGKVQSEVATVPHYAMTADMWSSCTMEPYLSLTVDFISKDWLLKSYCLQMSHFPNYRTGELLAAGLQEALDSWGWVVHKLVAITTDCGANIKKDVHINNWTRLHTAVGMQQLLK